MMWTKGLHQTAYAVDTQGLSYAIDVGDHAGALVMSQENKENLTEIKDVVMRQDIRTGRLPKGVQR